MNSTKYTFLFVSAFCKNPCSLSFLIKIDRVILSDYSYNLSNTTLPLLTPFNAKAALKAFMKTIQ